MRKVVLPQALRNVIPAIVGQFISLFKDTSLLAIVGFFEVLEVARSVPAQSDFVGQGLASVTLAFAGFLYWVGCYTMSTGEPAPRAQARGWGHDEHGRPHRSRHRAWRHRRADDHPGGRREVVRPASQALKGIDLVVGRQEVVVVIGPSGSGKSTLIRCINRLEEHDRGRIVVDGTELTDDVRNIQAVRREVGMVFQQLQPVPAPDGARERHAGARARCAAGPKAKAEQVGRGAARAGAHPRAGRQVPRASCRAASSSAWPSPGRWPCSPRSCCSTSRPRRSTPR